MKLTLLVLGTLSVLLDAGPLCAADPQPPTPAPKSVIFFVDLSTLQVRRLEMDEERTLIAALLHGEDGRTDSPAIHLWRGEQHLKLLRVTEKKIIDGTLPDPALKPNDLIMLGVLTPEACKRLSTLPEIIEALKHPSKDPIPLSKDDTLTDEPVTPL